MAIWAVCNSYNEALTITIGRKQSDVWNHNEILMLNDTNDTPVQGLVLNEIQLVW